MDGTSATHASTATLSRQEACLLPTLTYPRSPSCWHVCLHDGPSWPSSRSWQLVPFDSMTCVRDVHGSHWDVLRWQVLGKHTAVAGMHYDDECKGSAR